MKTLALSPLLLLFVACSPEPSNPTAPATPEGASAATPTSGPAPRPITGRAYRYTSLEDCKLMRAELDEMPYAEVLCPGPANWGLRITDADARQTLSVIAPDGKETKLDLSRTSGGAFSSFGTTAEWRGPVGESFAPDSVIVRFNVAEQPHPAPEAAYLLAIRLRPTPCLVERVASGPGQNDTARAATDAGRDCSG